MSIATLLETFKGFFSRSFWFGAFLPVATVTAIHAALGAAMFPTGLGEPLKRLGGTDAVALPLVFGAMVLLAYILDPFGSLFAAFLDGSLMPRRLHNLLRNRRATAWQATTDLYRQAIKADSLIADLRKELVLRLAGQRAVGNAQMNADKAAIDAAVVAIGAAHEHAESEWRLASAGDLEPIDIQPLETAATLLGTALERNRTATNEPLDLAQRSVSDLLRRASVEMTHRLDTLIRQNPTVDLQDWQATRLGDVRRQYERYTKDAYGVSFAYLWPRVRMAIDEGDADASQGFTRQVADAASRSDFAVLLLLLLFTVPLVWLPLCLIFRSSPWLFVGIGLLSPPLLLGAYELVLRAETVFGLIMQAAVDRHRLSVLPLLNVARPTNLTNERALWRRLESIGARDAAVEITYAPSAGGAK